MTMTLDDFYAQMLGVAPPEEAALIEGPVAPQSPYLSPMQSDAMGLPFPTSLMGGGMPGAAPPESAQPDPMLGVTNAFGAEPTAPSQYGYSPQPRPMLPQGITDGAENLYGPFRQVWEGLQAEQDPLAALLAGPPAEDPMASRMVPEQFPMQAGQAWGQGPQPFTPSQEPGAPRSFVAGPAQSGERVLHGKGYGRVLDRVNWLRGLRGQQGY